MMTMKTANDGKGKHQSYEAKIVDAFNHEILIDWGATEEEAISNLKIVAEIYTKAINRALNTLTK